MNRRHRAPGGPLLRRDPAVGVAGPLAGASRVAGVARTCRHRVVGQTGAGRVAGLFLGCVGLLGPAGAATLGPPVPVEVVEATAVTYPTLTPTAGPVDWYAARPRIAGEQTPDELVALAFAHSPVLAAADHDLAAAREMLNAVRARLAPRLSATMWFSYGDGGMLQDGPGGVEPAATRMAPGGLSWDTNFMAMFPLATGGTLTHRTRAARATAAASEAERETLRLDVAYAVRTLAWKLTLDDDLIAVQQSELEALTERLRVDTARFGEGKIPEYYLHRDRAEQARARQALTDALRDRNIDLADLRTILGLHPASDLAVVAPFTMPPAAPEPAADLATAAAQRPELTATRQRVQAAWHDEKAANGAFLPQIDLVAMADLIADRGGRWETWLAGIAIGLPLADGGERRANVREARARRGQLSANEQAQLLQIGREVSVAHEDLTAARENLDTALLGQVAAEEDYRVVTARFDAGKAINIELLDALQARVAADTRVAQARYRLLLAEESRRRATADPRLVEGGKPTPPDKPLNETIQTP